MKLSVIIPVYNCDEYLSNCIESVLQQTYYNLEILLIDDGSTDRSGAICDDFAKKDNRIIVLHQKNKGVSAARNLGLKHASGQVISFVDADDTLDLDMYEFLCSLMVNYQADIVHCGYKHIVGNEVRLVHNTKKLYIQSQDEALECLVGGRLFDGGLWNKLYRKEVLVNNFFDETIKMNEDILFNYQVFRKAKKIVFSDYAKYNYIARLNESACFSIPSQKKIMDGCKVNKYIYEHSKGESYEQLSAERYLRSLSLYYRLCYASKERIKINNIRNMMWKIYRENKSVGRNMAITTIMIKFVPWLYLLLYNIYNVIRKPSWEAKG